MKKTLTVILLMAAVSYVHAAQFEELDKPPEGAHKGQMLLGIFATIGVPYGTIIDAENKYIKNSTYTFFNNFITKKIMLQHLTFSYGLFYEYMPVDYFGLKVKAKRSSVIQRSQFGAEYENWTRLTYSDYSFFLGPSIHFTSRRMWDISLTPLAGYALGKYVATPIAAHLIYSLSIPTMNQLVFFYNAKREKQAYNWVIGGEFNISMYFTGGFYMAFSFDWTMNMLEFDSKFYINNMQTYAWFFPNKSSSYLHSVCFMLSVGYAFSN